MRISTSLNIYQDTGESYKDILNKIHECGFSCGDLNFGDSYGDTPFNASDWRSEIKKVREYADIIGFEFTQAHAFCFVAGNEPDDADFQIKKTIEAAAIANVPWIVIHPFQKKGAGKEEVLKYNLKRLEEYAEYAEKFNIGLAVENMARFMYWYCEKIELQVCYADELIYIVDNLRKKYKNVGVCWDTGHANLSMKSQYDDIVKLGDRLKLLHIADNDGQCDDHTAPFMGYINWDEVVKALKNINYKGTFNFETHNFVCRLPKEIEKDGFRMLYKIGEYLVSKIQGDSE